MKLLLASLLVACAAHARPISVGNPAEAARALGRLVRVTGVAGDAKLGAVVETGGLVVYLRDRSSWGAAAGTTVTVEGVLEQTSEFVAPPDSAGTQGPVYVIRKSTLR